MFIPASRPLDATLASPRSCFDWVLMVIQVDNSDGNEKGNLCGLLGKPNWLDTKVRLQRLICIKYDRAKNEAGL
jgi:hypothetical protein